MLKIADDANKDGIAATIALLEGAKDVVSVAVTGETVTPTEGE